MHRGRRREGREEEGSNQANISERPQMVNDNEREQETGV
jgi:hypothetical protein